MKREHRRIAGIALEEAGAIMRSWGYRFAALAPLLLFIFAITLMSLWSSADPRRALVVETQFDLPEESVVAGLRHYIGPDVPQTELRDAQAGLWIPVAGSTLENGHVVIDGSIIEIGARAIIRSNDDGELSIHLTTDAAPIYMMDLLHIAVVEANMGYTISVERVRQSATVSEPMSLGASLLHLVTILLAAATGALGAAASYALTTAYLTDSRGKPHLGDDPRDIFVGKLLGIGGAYAALAFPWGIVGALSISGLAIAGDPALSSAMLDVAGQLLLPSRLLVFLIGALAGYVLYAASVLLLARRAKTAAAARTLAGPATLIAVAPAPIALWAQNTGSDILLPLLSWFPLTAPAALQLRVGQTPIIEMALPLTFLVFCAVTVLRLGAVTAARE
ncbi:MAG: hypothetical protein AAGA72_03300 [Pseudomonadota bacterium]